ncbi:TolC family protein [Chitinophagaceae bacterium LWZ2-11]
MTILFKNFRSIIPVLSAIAMLACNVAKPLQDPQRITVPDSAYEYTDSLQIDKPSLHTFFKDPYLQKLIDSTLKNNQDALIALQRIDIAKSSLLMSKAAMLPTLNATVSAGFDRYGDYTMNGVGNYDTDLSPNISKDQKIPIPITPDYFAGFRSQWEADIWGKLKSKKKAALVRFTATQQASVFIRTSLSAQTASLYYSLLALDNELKIIERNIELQEAALEVVKIQKEGGRATELAVKQFQAQVYNTSAFRHKIKQQIAVIENELNFLQGGYPGRIERDSSLTEKYLPQQLRAGIPSSLLLYRPDIQEAELQLAASKADIQTARAAFYPSLNITSYIGINAFKPALLFNPASIAFGMLGGLTAPIFNQKQIKANHAIALAQNKEAYYVYQKTVLNAVKEVAVTLQKIEETKKMLVLKEKETEALYSAISSAKDLYISGYATYLEIILAQKSALDAELELNQIKKDQLLLSIDLYRQLGGGKQ